ncbi:MAG: flotillin-like protein FloA [Nitrospira sp.]|nr:flotillin-like protein FloA [Nitrospira sp.]MDH4343542.1 flotillin-like protein FloA [Nitrospira sp.]MDH5337868.1 flotillin-like protein FloA [Nitrospira sp.]
MNELETGLVGILTTLMLTVAGMALLLYLIPLRLWIAAWASGAYVGLLTLIGMRLRRVPPDTVVTARISAVKAGLTIPLNDLEAHYLAGGNVVNVVLAMISADKANIPMPFKRAAAIDLAGRDVLGAVKMSVLPKVIETPRIAAVAKDGIQLHAICRVTVRTNLDRLVGGAGEETVLARVGEGIVSTIGSAETHKNVLENPDHISKHVLAKGLDAGTAFEILSIDIADIDVGENIGAKLQIDQADADKQIAQARAEQRRAMAVALEQEMRAKVVEAEAEVPKAMAEAFRQGNLGIMDYYRMKNVQADTSMRDAIAGTGEEPPTGPTQKEHR